MSGRPWIPTLLGPLAAMVIGACGMLPLFVGRSIAGSDDGISEGNGERIFFSAVSKRSGRIDYRGGPPSGWMMMGGGGLACVSCHGAEGRGGVHVMHMLPMDAPDIRWSTLTTEMSEAHSEPALPEGGHGGPMAGYDLEAFRLAVVDGQHPDGTALGANMPRWDLGDEDLADLAEFLRSLP